MVNKLGVAAFAQQLSVVSGKPKKLCEDFIKELFHLCSEALELGETFRIKGFGTFKIVDSDAKEIVSIANGEKKLVEAHKKVVFTTAKELAAMINSPFEIFDTIELEEEDLSVQKEEKRASAENVEDVRQSTVDEEISDENKIEDPILEVGSEEEGDDDEITSEAYHAINLPVYYGNYTEGNKKFSKGFLWGALSMFALCLLIFMLGCFFDWWPINFGKTSAELVTVTSIENQVPIDTISLVQEAEALKPIEEPKVYDTVSTTRYLTTIAREHYGNFNFWPYIYEENKDILGHPDRITPGTKVVVPPLSKYGVDIKNKEDIETAKKKAAEIYARYR